MPRVKQSKEQKKQDDEILVRRQEQRQDVDFKINLVKDSLTFLLGQYKRYEIRRQRWENKLDHYTDIWMNWLYYDIHFYEKMEFAGEKRPKFADLNELYKAMDLSDFWLAFDCYREAKMKWRLRMTEKVRVKILKYKPQKREEILAKCIELAAGYIEPGENCSVIEVGPAADMVGFETLLSPMERLVFVIQLDRLPIVHENRVLSYRFHHYLKLIGIAITSEQTLSTIRGYHKSIQNDADRWLKPEWSSAQAPATSQSFESCVLKTGFTVGPKAYTNMYLTSMEARSITYDEDKNRWLTSEAESSMEDAVTRSYVSEMNSQILSTLADGTSCQGFINLLETLPNFRIRLTDEERDLIGTPGNVMALGRSGTGKTTCAVLRLFSSEVVFRYRSQQAQIRRGLMLAGTKLGPEDIDNRCGLHTIFVTASPVLTNEVRRYYLKLNDHIKRELERKNERERQRKQKQMDQSYIVLEEEIKIEVPEKPEEDTAVDADEEELTTLPPSMNFVKEEDFPLFLTVRRLVFMIDGSLNKPFFARDPDGNVIGLSGNSEWHNEMKGVLVISKDYKDQTRVAQDLPVDSSDEDSDSEDDENDLVNKATRDLMLRKTKDMQKTLTSHRSLSFEVDFEYFYQHFWSQIRYMVDSEPLVVWTEISSTIKGSGDSHMFVGWFLGREEYLARRNKNSMISREEMKNIYEAFCKYERWKNFKGAYDFQDLVNFILNSLRFKGYSGVPIHYMMVDEVQDLTHATLTLLLKVTEQSLFFSGDTAQTIAKGVGFRFCDLKSLFRDPSLDHKAPAVKQLTVNFRSHGKILDLANSVIALIETLFPQTIDKLAKERSSIVGPMPMIIDSQNIEALFLMLFGSQSGEEIQRERIEFGCSQVIIVRNQQSKEDLPDLLKHALVLTVYEAKGLEFEDVLLYNFFTDSPLDEEQWRLLTRISRSETMETFVPSSLEAMELPEVAKLELEMRNFDPAKYSLMCTELKQLYVAITRPKQRLIIFDQNTAARQNMLNYWTEGSLVNIVQFHAQSTGIEIAYSIETSETKHIAISSSTQAWRDQGMKMLKNGFYEQAEKCFRYAEDPNYEGVARAYALASQASKHISKSTELVEGKKATQQKVMKSDRRMAKEEAKAANLKFKEAAELFKRHNLPKNAAKCLFSAGKPLEAADLFESVGMFGQAAEAFAACKNYRKAGEQFMKAGEYSRAIECLKMVKDYEKILDVIHANANSLSRGEKDKLIKKYVALALEELMPRVVHVTDSDVTNRMRKEDATIEEVAEEENSSSDDSDSEDNSDEDAHSPSLGAGTEVQQGKGQAEESKDEESQVIVLETSSYSESVVRLEESQDLSESIKDDEIKISQSNPFGPSFIALSSTNPFLTSGEVQLSATNPFLGQSVVIDEVQSEGSSLTNIAISQHNPFNKPEEDSSFILLSDNSSQVSGVTSVISRMTVFDDSNLDELSNYDPNDEWIQTESIIESLTSANKQDGSVSSDYSILDNVHASAVNRGCALVKTRADIFVEDETMLKIIRYVSMFSQDVESYLTSLRSADELTVKKDMLQSWQLLSLVDMDQIDVSLVCLILDVLEYFELYKLCLVVCNRYHLADRLGRYVTALAHKYSNIAVLKVATIDRPGVQTRQASVAVLGYTALHNMFEMINPEYLKLKLTTDHQTLGLECLQALLMMGFWKKTVYIMDVQNSLAVLWTFADFRNYKIVSLQFCPDAEVCKATIPTNDFSWLPFKSPATLDQAQDCMVALDSVTSSLNALYPVTLRSAYLVPDIKQLPEFPSYFKLNAGLWGLILRSPNVAHIEAEITRASQVIIKLDKTDLGSALELTEAWDALTFIVELLYASEKCTAVKINICRLSVDDTHEFMRAVHKAIRILKKFRTSTPVSTQIWFFLSALVAPIGVRLIKPSPVTMALPILTHCVVSRTSPLIPSLVGKFSTYVADIELKCIFALQTDVFSHVAMTLYSRLEAIQKARFTYFIKEYKVRCPTDIKPTEAKGKAHYMLTTAAGLFGELYLIDRVRRLLGLAESLEFVGATQEKADPLKEIRRANLTSELKLYEEMLHESYLPPKVKEKIFKLNKELAELGSNTVKIVNLNSDLLVKLVISYMHYFLVEPPHITSSARSALTLKAQSLFRQLSKKTDEVKLALGPEVFRLLSLVDAEMMFQEQIRALYRAVDTKWGKKIAHSEVYRDFVPWVDMAVFYRLGAWSEFLAAAFATLDQIGSCLDYEEIFKLLMRVSFVIALLGKKTPLLSAKCTKDYPELADGRLSIAVMRSDVTAYAEKTLTWVQKVLSEVTANRQDCPKSFKTNTRYIVGHLLQADMSLKPQVAELTLLTKDSRYHSLLDVKDGQILQSYAELFGKSAEVSLGTVLDEAQVYRSLDLAWIDEVRVMARRKAAARLIRRTFKGRRVKLQKSRRQLQVSSLVERYGLVLDFSRCLEPELSEQVHQFWVSNRTSMQLLHIISKGQLNLSDTHYTSKLYTVLDRHYLTSKFSRLSLLLEDVLRLFSSASAASVLSQFCIKTSMELEHMNKDLVTWRAVALPLAPAFKDAMKMKRKWNANWKLKLERFKKPSSGLKRNLAQQKKRIRLKNKGQS
jgi:tetratricopeptide (TPR) repeat protein